MERSCAPVFVVLALLILSSFSALFTVEELPIPDLEEHQSDGILLSSVARSSTTSVDISPWRIGDEWVYETTFDVAGLIASANISGASVNTLTGDTYVEVEDVIFMDLEGIQTLAYQVKSEGDFSTGNNGAYLEGYNGRVDMEYEAYDLIRVSDLATIYSNFSVDVEFLPLNLGFLAQDVGLVQISNYYEPPNEGYDFPMMMGDTWNNSYYSETNITGESDYFDLDGYNTSGNGTTTHQVTQQGNPSNSTKSIQYTGCGTSLKINAWNESGDPDGFRWYCPAARSYAWNSFVESSLGMQIDWLLKEYDPIDSQGSNIASSPGIRMTVLDVNPQFDRVRPDADLAVWANYSSNMGQTPATNKNLQLRWEVNSEIQSLTTRFNGSAWSTFNVGDSDDNSTTIEDVGSHGVIVWDPVAKFVGVSTVVLDPDVTAIDLVARTDNVVVERIRDGTSVNVQPNSINTIPGDELKFTMLVQNRGTETSPATDVELSSPDGSSSRVGVPSLTPMESLSFVANWTVPVNQAIGNIALTFEVDPDENITEDGNRSNNIAAITFFVGRVPMASFIVLDGFLSHENATVNASMSYDPDGGDVTCDFHIDEDGDGLPDITRGEDDCILVWTWNDDGEYLVSFTIYDDEGDAVMANTTVTVFNRAPWLNLSAPANVTAESQITINASDYGDLDSHNEPVSISWPDVMCNEGLTQPTCTFSPDVEGEMTVTAVAQDEDNATTSATISFIVLNRPPQLDGVELWINGSHVEGEWEVFEDETVQLIATGNDTLLDLDSLFYHWIIDADVNPNESVTTWFTHMSPTSRPSSTTDAMWSTAGFHRIKVELFDDDGASGGVENRFITVINVPPVVPAIEPPLPIAEDQDVSLSGGATDTASDADNLILCWDLYPETNTDDNGSADDDCDIEGKLLVHNFAKKGNYTVVFHATDDDGDSTSTNVTITVVNKDPTAILTGDTDLSDGLTLVEGESYTFYGFLSEDTPSDSDELWIWWDNDCLDSDGDSQASGDIDVEDVNATFDFPTPSTCVITLHVEDTDGGQSTTNVSVTVEALPITEAFLGSISQPTTLVGILIVILSLLLVFMFLRGRSPTSQFDDDKSWSSEPTPGLMSQATGDGVFDPLEASMGEISAQLPSGLPPAGLPPTDQPVVGQPLADQTPAGLGIIEQPSIAAYGAAAITTMSPETIATPMPQTIPAPAQTPNLTPEPAPTVIPDPVSAPVQTPPPTQGEIAAPPVPASGLPHGWSLEQWKFYGANWLQQQQSAASSQVTTANDSSMLDDDLDF